MVFIVPLCIVGLFLFFSCNQPTGLRIAFCKAFITTGLLIAFGTELLSTFNGITQPHVFVFWLLSAMAVCALLAWRLTGRNTGTSSNNKTDSNVASLRTHLQTRLQVGVDALREQKLLAVITALILLGTFITAICAAPNNYDSLTYHMARVPHWIQQQNVEFHATNNGRQNMFSPFSEYVILHAQLLSGSDRFANIGQWVSLLISMTAGSLIIKQFGHGARVQIFAAFLIVTIPMAILQASSTQNDLVTGALCLSFAVFLFRSLNHKRTEDLFFCGAALGLALFAKSTSWLFCCAIGVCLCCGYAFSPDRFVTKVRVAVLMLAVVVGGLSVNAVHSYRNFQAYGSLLSSPAMKALVMNNQFTPEVVYANAVRNVGLHLGTGSKTLNEQIETVIVDHLGEHAADSVSTFGRCKFEVVRLVSDDAVGNFWHLLLMPTLLLALFKTQYRPRWEVISYVLAIVTAFALFCVLLKWQTWGSRLQLPIFLLAAPAIAIAIHRLTSGRKLIVAVIIVGLGLASYEPTFRNGSRNLLSSSRSIFNKSRAEHYFRSPEREAKYRSALKVALSQGDDSIGLLLGGNTIEYPLWVLAGKSAQNRSPQFVPLSNAKLKTKALPEILIVDKKCLRRLPAKRLKEVLYSSDLLSVVELTDVASDQTRAARVTAKKRAEVDLLR